MSLKIKTARNSIMMGSILLIARPINLTLAIILARLLEPGEFGLVTLALILIQSSNLFTNLGLDKAIIHSSDEPKQFAFHSFLIAVGTSALFALLIFTNSEILASLLGDLQTAPLLRWLSGLILLGGLSMVPLSLLRKQLLFQYIALANLCSILCYAIAVLSFAYTGWGVWSLVYANILSTLLSTILYWLWCPGWIWIVPTRWDGAAMKRLSTYGVQVCFSGFLSYFHTHWDDWLVGRVLGVTSLGYYNKAYDFSNTTVGQLIRSTIGMVFLPSYTKIKDNQERLARAYLKTVHLVFLLVTPVAFGLSVVAVPLVQILFGNKWLPMATVLQIFALLILTRPISENSSPLFQATGNPSYNTRASFVLLATVLPAIFFLIRWEIEGVALAVALSHLIGVIYNLYQVNTILPGTVKSTLKIAVPILCNGIGMALVVQWAKTPVAAFFGDLFNLRALFSLMGIGAVVYLTLSFLTQRNLMREISQILLTLLPAKLGMQRSSVTTKV